MFSKALTGEIRAPKVGSDGMTLAGLRRDAKLTANGRGHTMMRFNGDGVSTCRACGDILQVDGTSEPPLGIDLRGAALTVDCTA